MLREVCTNTVYNNSARGNLRDHNSKTNMSTATALQLSGTAAAHLVILIGVPLPLLVPPVNALSSLRLLRGICCLALIRLNCRPGYHRASVYTRNAICCGDMNSMYTLDTDTVQLTQDDYCGERNPLLLHALTSGPKIVTMQQ
jgi:hypothetical protein